MKPCLLLTAFLFSACAYGQIPGRLFFTPAERANIDQSEPAPAAAPIHRLDGTLESAKGRRTYWINGLDGDKPEAGLAVGDSSNTPLLPANSLRIHRDETKREK